MITCCDLPYLDVTMLTAKPLHTFANIHRLGTVKSEKCLCVFPRNDCEPNVVFSGPEKAATLTPKTMKFPSPNLAVEMLSSSTEHRDRGVTAEKRFCLAAQRFFVAQALRRMI